MKKIKYWDFETSYKSFDEEFDKKMFELNEGNKVKINVHQHSCNDIRYPKLFPGKHYWADISEWYELTNYVKIKVTYKRNGVVFYKIGDSKKEMHLEEGSLFHQVIEPEELNVNLSSKYYEVVGRGNKMKVNYLRD